MRRRADQPHHPALDIRQQHVLLRLVEAMDLVDEQDRRLAHVLEPVGCHRQHPAHLCHVRFHAAETHELVFRPSGDYLGQRGLSSPWRSVENQRLDPIRFDRAPKQLSWTEDVRLAGELVQVTWPHSRRQGLRWRYFSLGLGT